MISSFSLPTAVSKLVSIRLAKKQRRNAFRVFLCSLMFAVVVGLVISMAIFFGASLISTHAMKSPLSVYALRVLAPCILVVAFLGVFRGFFQGFGTMIPTAVSQTVEQIINAIVSIVGAYMLLKVGQNSVSGADKKSYGAAYAAAGATLGTVAGALAALVFLILLFFEIFLVNF